MSNPCDNEFLRAMRALVEGARQRVAEIDLLFEPQDDRDRRTQVRDMLSAALAMIAGQEAITRKAYEDRDELRMQRRRHVHVRIPPTHGARANLARRSRRGRHAVLRAAATAARAIPQVRG
jgi:hypothetical protein